MIKDISTVKIGAVWNAGRGATYKDEIESNVISIDSIQFMSPLCASLLMIRMKKGVSVILKDLTVSLRQTCARCMENFIYDLHIDEMEAHFYNYISSKHALLEDRFPISRKDMSIDLTEAVRQEIILHFPMIPVCSKHCKGLCVECHVNLNKKSHNENCSQPDLVHPNYGTDTGNRPFANLKNYFQN